MRTLHLLALVTVLAPIASHAQVPSSTPIIGYYKQTISQGTTPVVCAFVTKKDFQGAMTSHTPGAVNSTITQNAAGWTINQFQTSAIPATQSSHYIELLSGVHTGLILDIVSNTATTLVIEGNTAALPANPVSGLSATETYCIRKHNTLGQVLAGGGGLTGGSDSVTLFNTAGVSAIYFFNGANWEDGDLNIADNIPIYPGQGILVTRASASPATITVGGGEVSYVKSGPTKIPLFNSNIAGRPVNNFVGALNPLVSATETTALGSFGLVGGIVAGSDSVTIYSPTGSLSASGPFISNGSFIEDGDLNNANSVPVRNGAAFNVVTTGARIITVPQSHPTP